jgi:signal transduction histidine kinase
MFFRATDHSHGSGIGLYIVKEAIEKLHGSITVDSKEGDGSVFNIRIPNRQHELKLINK